MKQKDKREIKKIMKGMECPLDFECYKMNFKVICEAERDSAKEYVSCRSESVTKGIQSCKFYVNGRDIQYCTCPLRTYLAKKFNI